MWHGCITQLQSDATNSILHIPNKTEKLCRLTPTTSCQFGEPFEDIPKLLSRLLNLGRTANSTSITATVSKYFLIEEIRHTDKTMCI